MLANGKWWQKANNERKQRHFRGRQMQLMVVSMAKSGHEDSNAQTLDWIMSPIEFVRLAGPGRCRLMWQ